MRVLLIDLSHLWWSAWHASADREVGFAFTATLEKVRWVKDTVPHDACAICCDAPPYWRSAVNPEYKAQRAEVSELAIEQFRRVRERLEKDGELLWRVKGFEADDVIAQACRIAEERGDTVTIATNDKDLLQLVSANTVVLATNSGDVINAEGVAEKFGVPPPLIAQLLAMTGDKSDNVPGIPRVGVKTAAKLINTFGSALNAINAARDGDDSITPALRKTLADNWQNYGPALVQIELTKEVPIDYDELTAERERTPDSVDWSELPELDEESEMGDESDVISGPPESGETPAEDTQLGNEKPERATALARRVQPADWSLALEPNSCSEAYSTAKALEASRLYTNFGSREAIFAIILRGRALGMDATTALASFHIVEGRPTMHADLIVARVLASGKAEYFERTESTNTSATYVTKRKGGRHEQSETFTIDDAFAAGLVQKGDGPDGYVGVSKRGGATNWDKYRRVMLRHRAAAALARDVYPDVTLGLYTPDEVVAEVVDAEFQEAS